MQPCTQEDNIKQMRVDIDKLRLSDVRKEQQISHLLESIKNLISWVKIFVGTTITTLVAVLGFLIHYWVKG